jgi:hypothetical protein
MSFDEPGARGPHRPGPRGKPEQAFEDLGAVRRKQTPRRQRRRRSALAVLAAILVAGIVAGSVAVAYLHARSTVREALAPSPAKRAVIFLIDGLRPGDLSDRHLSTIRTLVVGGVNYDRAWIGQLESVEPASAATLATGVFPRRHQIPGAVWRDPNSGSVIDMRTAAQVKEGIIDQRMQAARVPALAQLLKLRRSTVRIIAVGGAGCGVANAAASWEADFVVCPALHKGFWSPSSVAGHQPPAQVLSGATFRVKRAGTPHSGRTLNGWTPGAQDAWIARTTVRLMHAYKPALTVVAFPELEAIRASRKRVDPQIVADVLQGLDRDIATVRAELRRERAEAQTVYVMTAGEEVPPRTRAISMNALRQAVVSAGGEAEYWQAGQSIGLGVQNHLQSQPVAQAIQGEGVQNTQALYYKTGTGSRRHFEAQYLNPSMTAGDATAAASLLATMSASEAPDVMIIGPPGAWAHNATGAERADSLGTQWDTQHIPLVLAGHGVREGLSSAFPARLIDIAPTLAAVMGLRVTSMDGRVLADSLDRPPSGALSAQSAERNSIQAIVSALRRASP